MEKFDVVIIGAGPSGFAAAMRALDYKKSVCIIEKGKLGGAGVHNGALWSKTFWELSKDASSLRNYIGRFGGTFQDIRYKDVVRELDAAVNERVSQLQRQLDFITKSDSTLFKVKQGEARLLNNHDVSIQGANGQEIISGEYIILATGSTPRYLPNIPIDENIIVTSDGIGLWKEFPKSMVVLGAGVIGCEFATIFSNFGKTKVHLIDKADRILPFEDADVVREIAENMENKGVVIHRNSSLKRMEIIDGMVEYELEYKDGYKKIYRVEKALVSVGRVPNTKGLGLEELGVEMNDRGCIMDNDSQTSVPNIYAIGDITADIALVNVGELEGRHAIERIFGGNMNPLSRKNISTIMFVSPISAGVGMNELQCREQGINYRVATLDFSAIPRAIAMRNTQGFFKIIVTNDHEMRVLGMRAIGVQASSAIQGVALLIQMEKSVRELAELIHPHPSIIEGIQECARMLMGTSILKPEVFGASLQCKSFENGEYKDICHF